jgi:transposase
VEEAADRTRLWVGHHLLAVTARLARRRGMGPTAPGCARSARPARAARLVAYLRGLGECPGQKGGELTGPNPTDRGKSGSKYHLLVTADGLPLAVAVTGADRHDSVLVEPILDSLRPVKIPGQRTAAAPTGQTARRQGLRQPACAPLPTPPRDHRPHCPHRHRHLRPAQATHRRVLERTVSWLLAFRRLALRYDRTEATITALATLTATMICIRRLTPDNY